MLIDRLAGDHLFGKQAIDLNVAGLCLWWHLFMLSFFPRDGLNEIRDLI